MHTRHTYRAVHAMGSGTRNSIASRPRVDATPTTYCRTGESTHSITTITVVSARADNDHSITVRYRDTSLFIAVLRGWGKSCSRAGAAANCVIPLHSAPVPDVIGN